MKNKYYTPTIEEFHVGFEYETVVYSTEEEKEWVKCIYSRPTDAPFCKDSNGNIWTNESLRVKLLDREDIESLRFELYVIKDHTISFLKKCTGFSVFIIYQETNTVISVYINAEKVFLGNIKNKSELQKLMTQLNIK